MGCDPAKPGGRDKMDDEKNWIRTKATAANGAVASSGASAPRDAETQPCWDGSGD